MAEVVTKECRRCGRVFDVPRVRGQGNRLFCSPACAKPPPKLDGSPQSRGGVNRAKARGKGAIAGNPATGEMDYTDDEAEFLKRVGDYKKRTGRQFPTCTELFRIVLDMGYRRVTG